MSYNNEEEDSSIISLMDLDQGGVEVEGEDPFLAFIEYAKSELSSSDENDDIKEEEEEVEEGGPSESGSGPGWSWTANRILKTCISYPSGVTAAILLSDLALAWNEQRNRVAGVGAPEKNGRRPEWINQLKKTNNHRNRRSKLLNTVTIDSIYEKNFLSLNSVLEAVIVDVFVLPGTNIYMLTLGDFYSCNTIDLYLHRRYYDLVDPHNGILKKGREVYITGCHLRTAREGCGSPRLLPTEYLVILLDEDQDDDAILLAAQFCSDSFSCISLDDVNKGVSYSLYARIESIGLLETRRNFSSLQMKQITLVDNDGVRLKFLLWGEQVLLANLCSVGCILALDRPYIASSAESGIETNDKFCLEYGSATQLYMIPCIQQEEQVCISLTQKQYGGSRPLSASHPSQDPIVSQVTLPCDSQGSIDFSNFPFRSFIVDLRGKMTGISLYAVVTEIFREKDTAEVIFNIKLDDNTEVIWAKLHFARSWSLGRLGIGHIVYISGLKCSVTKQNSLEVLWFEKDAGASFINLSCLPAMLNSSCLHKLSRLCDLSGQTSSRNLKVCRVWLDQINNFHVTTRFSHSVCGHFVEEKPGGAVECNFCCCNSSAEVVRTFLLEITLADDSAKVFAWCTGQTASELLQITPDEFLGLPEEDQVIYPSSLENDKYMVVLVNAKQQGYGVADGFENSAIFWEITCALKYD